MGQQGRAGAVRRMAWVGVLAAACGLMSACGGGGGGGGGGTSTGELPSTPPVTDSRAAERAAAARFLTQATFGPRPDEVEHVLKVGPQAWLEEQFELPRTSYRLAWEAAYAPLSASDPTGGLAHRQVLDTFWAKALDAPDQLRQRVVYALSQIFVISLADPAIGSKAQGAVGYLDVLGEHAFGNYRDLLEAVSRHPMMGVYLSHLRNQKPDATTGRVPDQNYAREVMQLFAIGLHRLRPDGSVVLRDGQPVESYTQADVVGLSQVFTGFSWAGPDTTTQRFNGHSAYRDPDRLWKPMQAYPQFHSLQEKRFLGTVVPAQASADPEASLRAAMDVLAAHPNVGPFIGRQLIQRLVTSNPSRAYVARVAAAFNDNGAGVRGDMKAVIRAVLMDPEARDMSRMADPAFGKLREPVLRLSAFLRAFGARSDSGQYLLGSTDNAAAPLGQSPLHAPSVFNFYRPGYVPPGTAAAAASLVAPEMQITHESSVAGYASYMASVVREGAGLYGSASGRRDLQPDYGAALSLAAQPAALVERLNQLLLYGQMSAALRAEVEAAVAAIVLPSLAADRSNQAAVEEALRTRVHAAVLLVLVSPEFVVQK